MTAQSDRPLLPVRAVSERTGIDERTLRRAAAAGEVPARRFRRRWFIFPSWVDEYLTPPPVPEGGEAA